MSKNKNKTKNGERKNLLFLSVFFLFSVLNIIFSGLCLSQVTHPFVHRHFVVFSLVISVIIITLYIYSVGFIIFDRKGLQKVALSGNVLLAFFLILVYVLQVTGFFVVFNDVEKLQAYLRNAGAWMPIAYIFLQFLQVVILPIPGIVSTAAGGAIFGPFFAGLYSALGIISGSFVAFLIGRKWGGKAVAWMIGKDALVKWQKKLKGKDKLLLTLMFVLPFFPDDVLCFLAGLSTMPTVYFLVVIILTRLIGIFATCYTVTFIPFNTWWGILLWAVIILAVILSALFVYKYMDRLQIFLKRRRKRKLGELKEKK